jgi:hypothetical protein
MRKRVRRATVCVVLGLTAVTGCGSSGPSASEPTASKKVCDARSNLRQSVATVKDDLTSGNFGKARDDLPAVKDAFTQLRDAASGLKSEQTQALSPQIDALSSSLTNLTNVQSFADLQSGVAAVTSSLESLYTQIDDTLKCP